MATIHVARGATNIGNFSIEEIRDGLRTGQFLPTDLGWETGMPDWRPLAQLMAGKEAAMPAAGTAGPGAIPVDPSALASASESAPGSGLPWEHREQLGLAKAFIDTVAILLTRPAEAFGMMRPEGGLTDPLLFALIGGSAGMIVALLFQAVLQSVGFMTNRPFFGMWIGMGVGIVLSIVLMPAILICGLFIWSGIIHLCLTLLGGAKKPFETTFRVVCFSSGSSWLLAMVPCFGRLIAPVYNIVLQCIGVTRAHETDTGKAVVAVLIPIVVCCGGLFFLAVLGGFSALSLFPRH